MLLIDTCERSIVVDLHRVEMLDGTAISAIASLVRSAGRANVEVRCSHAVARQLEVAGCPVRLTTG